MSALLMILAAACWGAATVMTKGILERVPPFALLSLQLSSSVAFLWVCVLLTRTRVQLNAQTWRAASTGTLEPGMAYALGVPGLALTTASSASIIAATEPAIIVLLAWWLLRERPAGRVVAAISVAVIGVLLVSTADFKHLHAGDALGNALVLMGTVFAALYVVRSSRLVAQVQPLLLAALQQSVGMLIALGLLRAAVAFKLETPPTQISLETVLYAMLSGIVQYALAFWSYLQGMRGMSTEAAALFLVLIPVFGVGGAVVFLHETISGWQAAGVVLVVGAVLSIQRSS